MKLKHRVVSGQFVDSFYVKLKLWIITLVLFRRLNIYFVQHNMKQSCEEANENV